MEYWNDSTRIITESMFTVVYYGRRAVFMFLELYNKAWVASFGVVPE